MPLHFTAEQRYKIFLRKAYFEDKYDLSFNKKCTLGVGNKKTELYIIRGRSKNIKAFKDFLAEYLSEEGGSCQLAEGYQHSSRSLPPSSQASHPFVSSVPPGQVCPPDPVTSMPPNSRPYLNQNIDGDTNLPKSFVWNEKLGKEGLKSIMKDEIESRNRMKLEEDRSDIWLHQGVERPLFSCVASTSAEIKVEPGLEPGPIISSQDEVSSVVEERKSKNNERNGNFQPKEQEEPDPVKICEKEYISGRYSPVLISFDKIEPGILLTNPTEDAQRLEFMQQCTRGLGLNEDGITAEEKEFERAARKGMDADEAIFSVEFNVDRTYLLWPDKYRPRKPRYFNRVHTGFEWNKYNQTHYAMDNPPPKIVQGYKFNIFYPDLIDKAKTPEYTLTPCEENKDFAILKFYAGPPYEDIAFKIVNKEWEYSYERGFRCQFHNNIFQLWFHFQRCRYRLRR